MNDWDRGHRTLVGAAMTSRLSGRKVAASEHCVAIIITCTACGDKFLQTADARECPRGCVQTPTPTFSRAPSVAVSV